jgi:hypothetical protein
MSIRRAALVALTAVMLGSLGAVGAASPGGRAGPTGPESIVLGVVPQRPIDHAETARMSHAGIDSIRFLISWGQVESERGSYDWSASDSVIADAASAGLTALPFLYTEPQWALELDGYRCSVRCGTYAPSTAPTRGAYGQFAGAAVRRYGPGGTFWDDHPGLPYLPVRAWQIWNEQNAPFFFRPRPDTYLYAAMLGRASEEIRAADPGAEVVLGGVWSAEDRPNGVIGSAHYLRDLYRVRGVEESFDAVAIHPYDGRVSGVMDQIRAVRRVAGRADDGAVDLWVTELGWASSGKAREPLVKGRAGQARMLSRAFGRLRADRRELRLRATYWFAWRDTDRGGAICAWCAHSGLLSRSGREKPAYGAMRELARRGG